VAERLDGRVEWLVITRPAGSQTVLLARRVTTVGRLTAAQRRRVLLGGLLGLVGGGLGGLALALSVTRPLGRLAGAARRLSAGERDVDVPPQGPTEVADVAEALGALSRALSASEERQRRFLLAVSHELRTPLTAVAGYAEALADSALPAADVPHAAQVIVTEAGRLQRRVEDLMALARLEADDFRLVPAPTDVGAVVRAAAASIVPRATAAGVRLTVATPEVGPVVVTDGERLRQVIDALADNALKVLGAGAPLVIACLPLPDGGVRLEVRDGGPGLPPEDLAVAFERGRLTERYRGSRPVGSGVGLALVGELARRLGGSAQATPAPEGGVCFAVTLPPHP
jgi:two-component system sensor histidine kinase BaeS